MAKVGHTSDAPGRCAESALGRLEPVSGGHTDDLRVAVNTLFTATPATSGQCAAILTSLRTASATPEELQEAQASGVGSSGVVAAIPRPAVVTVAKDSDLDSISSEPCIIVTGHGAKRERVRERQRCGVRHRRGSQGEPSQCQQLHRGPVTIGSGGASGSGQQRTAGHPTRKRRRKSKW